ncbi:MAG: hypothetical protein F6K19_43810 [Cyanothece sp. SIO1E1]|nr:hypothetical protein [Cyanothece sp. SIO1E1]
MARLYYRGMVATDGKPKLGRSARLLGIRPGADIDVSHMRQGWLDSQGYLHPEAERDDSGVQVEVAIRNTKGMSTSLSIEGLPPFRKPKAFGGTGRDPLWQIDSKYISGDLEAVQDSAIHVSIMPKVTMLLERYEAALAKTQNYWQKVIDDGVGI